MTITYQMTDSIGAGTQFDLAAVNFDSYYVGPNATVGSTNGTTTVIGTGLYQSVRVLGAVVGGGAAIDLSGTGSTVWIETGGLVANNNSYYTGNAAIRISGEDSTVHNYGRVSGGNAVNISGSGGSLYNFGDIDGTESYGSYNWQTAVQLGSTVNGDTKNILIENHGTITGVLYSIQGDTNYWDNTYETKDVVRNFGTLVGTVSLNEREDTVINAGLISGDVTLGDGDDKYIGKLDGYVSGSIDGGLGADTLSGSSVSDEIHGGDGDDVLKGKGGNDTLFGGSNRDDIKGGAGDDNVDGGAANDTVYGNAGDDVVTGGGGLDLLYGGAGNDDLSGGNGNDTIHAGAGDDTLNGGSGADEFVLTQGAGNNVITDFTNGSDGIDLSAFALSGYSAVSAAATEGAAGVLIDLTALGGAGSVLIEGFTLAQMDASDFIL
ncbi:MAG: calcium-binding protein [Rhodobacteraceae bacterium]|nr:calcium-binding protein [Paracoccaceae bacterium]